MLVTVQLHSDSEFTLGNPTVSNLLLLLWTLSQSMAPSSSELTDTKTHLCAILTSPVHIVV